MTTVKKADTIRRVNPFNLTTEKGSRRAQLQAHIAFFGCGNGGRDFDEFDASENYHSETREERWERQFGFLAEDDPATLLEDRERRQRRNHRKSVRRKAARAEEKAAEAAWRKEQQAKWR